MTRLAASMFMSLAALTFAGCAALPDDSPIVEQLDADTGATIARLGHPIELYRETFAPDATGRFAFIAPFETNQAGAREVFLWLAAPLESPAGAEPPTVEVNGKPLPLGAAGRAPDFAGLKTSPYKIPTPWSSMYYYRIDSSIAATLAGAGSLAVSVGEATKDGVVRTVFATQVGDDPRLKIFSARE